MEKNNINRYLRGEMEEAELTKFTLRLLKDSEFRKEVEAERLLHETILQDRQKFNGSSPKSSGRNKWFPLLIIAILLIGGGLFFFSNTSTTAEKKIVNPVKEFPEEKPILENKNLQETNIDETEDIPKTKETTSKKTESLPEKKPLPQKIEQPTRIKFAANFETNPLMENYLNQVRGNNLEVTSPPRSTKFSLERGKLNFQLNGYLQSNGTLPEEIISFLLFSNKKADYLNFKPLLSEELVFEKNESEEQLDFEIY